MNTDLACVSAPQLMITCALMKPISAPAARPASSAPYWPSTSIMEIVNTALRDTMPTTDKSINPPMMATVMPSATKLSGPNWFMMLPRLASVRNFGSITAVKLTSSRIVMSTRLLLRKRCIFFVSLMSIPLS